MSGDLLVVIPDGQSIVQVFQDGGCDPLIDNLEAELKTYAIDVTTEAGRKQIASIARKIASTKVALDDAGKALIADKQAQVALVNKERARIKDRMQKIQDDFRKPLTDFENEQKRLLAELEAKKREELMAAERKRQEELAAKQATAQATAEAIVDAEFEEVKPREESPPYMVAPQMTELKDFGTVASAVKLNDTEAQLRDNLIVKICSLLTKRTHAELEYLIEKIKKKWPE